MDLGKVKGFVLSLLHGHERALRTIATHQTAFLELAAFVATQEQYRLSGAETQMVHPGGSTLRVKTSTRGHPSLFSRIEVNRGADTWEVHMNLPTRGAFGDGIFCVDIGVSKFGAVPMSRKKSDPPWFACRNEDLITFAEVKKLVIYPMLLAHFIGIVHELRPDFLTGRRPRRFVANGHFEPALLALGRFSGNSTAVIDSFKARRFAVRVIPAFDVRLGRIRAGALEPPFDDSVEI